MNCVVIILMTIFHSDKLELHFADKLFEEGKYRNALIEYERLNFFVPDLYYQYQIGLCYERLGKLKKAAMIFDELGDPAQHDLVRIYIKLGEYSLARFVCENMESGGELIGWLYILEGRWDDGAQVFGALKMSSLESATLGGKELTYKSEPLAHLLSGFIPGMGEIYAGKLWDGVFTFLFNTIIGGLAVKSFKANKYLDGGLITIFLWNRFYWGGVENAIMSARKYNKDLKAQYIKSLKEKYKFPFE